MKKILIALILIALTGCTGESESSKTVSTGYEVDKLFTVDGCTAYRFMDRMTYRYFTNCNGTTQWEESCGKGCSKNIGIDTYKND